MSPATKSDSYWKDRIFFYTHSTGMFQKKTQGSACIKNLLRYIEDDKTALIIFHNPLLEVGFRFEISFLFHCQLLA